MVAHFVPEYWSVLFLVYLWVFVNVVSDLCDRETRNVLSSYLRLVLTRVSVRGIPELGGMLTTAPPETTLTTSTTLTAAYNYFTTSYKTSDRSTANSSNYQVLGQIVHLLPYWWIPYYTSALHSVLSCQNKKKIGKYKHCTHFFLFMQMYTDLHAP